LNRQGNDRGRQYRSAIFHANEGERRVAQAYIRQLDAAGVFNAPIVTRLEPLTAFYRAEDYHQDYARLNPGQPYIAAVALPKVDKLRKYHPDLLKG
jgi:peptide-methionine (S)-S-oxide reductase